ncbi:programmed cell death 1 ligand 2 isoform X2 [Melanotaenia boesemani]|uniref:programmed cell death 1 ligand 2 isoform X2 n=1 Tax=Melanotaenia boesemani TaxID=1250792 RepID=UPI001C058B4A|nr:programmed cell death 1 ligand 2 isoform X2 [Melanotaenia boesemani]
MASNFFIIFAVLSITGVVDSFVKLECDETSVGQHGQQSLLMCVIKPEQNDGIVNIRVVTWRKIGDEEPLLFFHNKPNFVPGYKFAESSWDESNMNVSLLITSTKVADEGDYMCEVVTDSGDDHRTTKLKVKARYRQPTISLVTETNTPNAHSALICTSEGGYPKGELRWFDENKVEWTASSQLEVKKMDGGLFQLSSTLPLLPLSTFLRYTCIVFNSSGIKEDETSFEMPQQYKKDPEAPKNSIPPSNVIAPVVVIGSLIVGLLLALLIYRRRSQKARRPSTTPLVGQWREVRRNQGDIEEGDTQDAE